MESCSTSPGVFAFHELKFRFFLPRACAVLIATSLIGITFGATGNAEPAKRDPAGQLFRRAPMASASRSIVIPLTTNLHVAFDAELLRTHTVWNGPGLNLLGPPYAGKKTPFICTFEGKTLWTTPPLFPWSFGKSFSSSTNLFGSVFRGISTDNGNTTLTYDVAGNAGKPVRIRETPVLNGVAESAMVRRFELAPSDQTLWFLVHAEMGSVADKSKDSSAIQRTNDVLSFAVRGAPNLKWHLVEEEVDYEVERITEVGTVKGNPRDRIKGRQSRAYLEIPPHNENIVFEIGSVVAKEKSPVFLSETIKAPRLQISPKTFAADPSARRPVGGDSLYRIEHFPLPKEIDLLVTGMDWLPDGNLAVCTWPGEIYFVENAQGPVEKARFRRFARGLNEPMGLKVVDGKIYVAQKAELTRVLDTDNNGEADLFETVNAGWGYSGNYDSFAFGPALDKDGNFVIAFEGNMGRWDVPYPGWAIKVSPDGRKLDGFAHGLRAPNGIAAFGPDRDIFTSDNQGHWIGACKLNHLQAGKFYGFPSSFPAANDPSPKTFHPPAIWFPRKYSPSTTDMAEITDARFGPFVGQMMVGDFQNALLMRVMLEKVNGEWQGAVWPFSKGFFSGVNRLSFGPDGKLYVGGCQRAWSSTVPQPYSLDRVSFTGKNPFEIREVHALTNGFELEFTQVVDSNLAGNSDNYDVSQFTYLYHNRYGSPEMDHDGNENSSTTINLKAAVVSPDGKKVKLVLEGWRSGFVTTVRCLDLQNAEGDSLRNDTFYYTLNQIPK